MMRSVAAVALIVAVTAACSDTRELTAQDYARIRERAVERLSDAQIRALHDKAQKEFARLTAASRQSADKAIGGAASLSAQCASDPVFRARNKGKCETPGPGIVTISDAPSSVDALFESYLLGICGSARTMEQARKMHCLP